MSITQSHDGRARRQVATTPDSQPNHRTPGSLALLRFPATMLIGVQYGAMVILPGLVKGNSNLPFLASIIGVSLSGAFVVELVAYRLRPPVVPPQVISGRGAAAVLTIGWIAYIAAALGGSNSYAVQIGRASASPLVSLATPFSSWTLFGVILYLWRYRQGDLSRKRALAVTVATGLMELGLGLANGLVGQASAFCVTIVVVAVWSGLIPLKALLYSLVLIPLLWPPLYDYRDTLRHDVGGSGDFVSSGNAFNRLELDDQMERVIILAPPPASLQVPSWFTLIRTGVLPSVLDGARAPLNTGSEFSVALGGLASNSTSATMLGNVFIFTSWAGTALVGGAFALMLVTALRRPSPWALMFAGLVYFKGISFAASYPDLIPGILQGVEAMGVAYLVVRLFEEFREDGQLHRAARGPHRGGKVRAVRDS